MALFFLWLPLLPVGAPPWADPASPAPHALPARILGRLLVWGAAAGMTPDQARRVFGAPDLAESFTNGPVTPGDAWTQTTYLYRRYGVSVHFHPRPARPGAPGAPATRIRGGIQ